MSAQLAIDKSSHKKTQKAIGFPSTYSVAKHIRDIIVIVRNWTFTTFLYNAIFYEIIILVSFTQ